MAASKRPNRAPLSHFGSRTDIGCVREHNEDSLVVEPPLYVVCDGMGGHAAGEVASEIATQVIADMAPAHPDANALGAAVEAANREILAAVEDGRGREGMGTTCTAAMLEGERLVIAQVGDSRAYLLHGGHLQQITRDHSLVADMVEAGQITKEEARVHPNRSMITRSLGNTPYTRPDIYEVNVSPGDRLLLCSDGLSGMILDDQIETIMLQNPDPQRCAAVLVNEAIGAGGYDNVTVVIADVEGFTKQRRKKLARKHKISIAIVLVVLAAIIGGTCYGLNYWVSTASYVTAHDGYVAVYRGVPGTVAGISFSQLDHTSNVSLTDLSRVNPALAQRLQDGCITTDNLDASNKLVEEYQNEVNSTAASNTNAAATNASSPTNGSNNAPAAGTGSDASSATDGATSGSAKATGYAPAVASSAQSPATGHMATWGAPA